MVQYFRRLKNFVAQTLRKERDKVYHKDGKHTRYCYIYKAARVEVGGVVVIKVPFCRTVKTPKYVTFAPAKHNVKNSVPRTVRWINWNFGFEKLTSQVKSSLLCICT